MPQLIKKSKAAKPAKPVEERSVVYPEIMVNGVVIPEEDTILTATAAREFLQWETEDDYAVRTGETVGSVKLADDQTLLTDANGKRVQCWANTKNRPFTEAWAYQIAQSILTGNFEFNLETVVISRTGQVTSGQHRLIGLVLAAQMWALEPGKYPCWESEPTIRTLIAVGGSDEQRVLNTIDNTRPQDPSDAFYRSNIFEGKTNVERQELSRMLKQAMDLLWKRTGYSKRVKYKTVSESVAFEERHNRLVDAVNHLFVENKKRAINTLDLYAGHCAGMMYLMAASGSDGDTYREADPPAQEALNLDRWDKAHNFFSFLAKRSSDMEAVVHTLAKIANATQGTTNGLNEKFAVLAKAFGMFLSGKKITKDDLNLSEFYVKKNEKVFLSDMCPNFGGIDMGHILSDDNEGGEDEMTPEQVKKAEAEERKKHAAQLNADVKKQRAEAAVKAAKTTAEIVADELAALEKKFPGRFLIIKHPTAGYQAYNGNAVKAAKLLGLKVTDGGGFDKLTIPVKDFDAAAEKLLKMKLKVAVVEKVKVDEKGTQEDKCRDLFTTPTTPAAAKAKPVARK